MCFIPAAMPAIIFTEYTDLKFETRVGGGRYGEVWKGHWKNNTVAIKKVADIPEREVGLW